jgi:FlaA1/EpsC-like NDP-sugar epimerase
MTRYFMSVSEAISLVIQAATLTEGGDIFLLDMGQQICIDELARRLIRLRGLRPDVDVPIVYIGPRPGEKMHEELLGDGEERETTSHPHIFRVHSKVEGGKWKRENGALRLPASLTSQSWGERGQGFGSGQAL